MVSMKEIAKKCNVSVASVSKALNGYSDISEETRKLILKTASEMGYLPNSSARTLKTKRSYNIGVMFVDEAASGLTHDYFNHVLESFKRTAEERGYDITFTSGRISGQKLSYYEHCRYRGVDGVVIACVDFYADEVQGKWIRKQKTSGVNCDYIMMVDIKSVYHIFVTKKNHALMK